MQCERCGKSLPDGSKFCLSCGHPVTPTRTMAMPPAAWQAPSGNAVRAPAPGVADRRRGLMTAVAALVVLALLLGGFSLVLGRRAREGAGIAQVAQSPRGEDFRLLPSPRSGAPVLGSAPPPANSPASVPPVTGAATNTPGGPGVLSVPAPNAGGPPVVGGPSSRVDGPSLLANPQAGTPGAPVIGSPARPQAGAPLTARPPLSAPNAPPLTAAPSAVPTGPPVTAQSPPERPTPPAEPQFEDISGYVRRLEQVELTRVQLTAQFTNILASAYLPMLSGGLGAGMGADDDGAQNARVNQQALRDFEIVARRYMQLNALFQRQVPPVPVSCRRLHGNYSLALTHMPSFVRQLQGVIIRRDLGSAMMMMQTAQGPAARGFQFADRELERLCDERRAAKPFDIGPEFRSGGIRLPGLP